MARKRKTPSQQKSLDSQIAELVALIKEVSPPSRIESLLSNMKMKMPISACIHQPLWKRRRLNVLS